MSRTKPDRRIARTEHSLHRALNTLILKKGYEATTIKDIVDQANVGRSTFYAHHGGKEGLMLSGLQHLRTALLTQQHDTSGTQRGNRATALGFSRVFFEHVHEYRDVLQAILATDSRSLVMGKIQRLLAEIVRQNLNEAQPEERSNEVPRDAMIQFTVDALISVLLWWFERSPKSPPADVDAIFRRLVLPGLAANGVRSILHMSGELSAPTST